jgi:DNA-binding MarR family transcriptional regulator
LDSVLQKEDIQSLKLMEEISREDGFTTQRELAKRLDVSVGLVNLFIKRVVRKGYFKITTIPGRRVRYLLTSEGFAEKSRLTMSYLRYSLSYFREIRLNLKSFSDKLSANGVRRVVLVGTGEMAELLSLSFQEARIDIVAVVSVNEAGERFLGRSVGKVDDLVSLKFDAVCIMELSGERNLMERLLGLGVEEEKIFSGADL